VKVLRQLVRNGNSTQVSIPQRMLDVLRWRKGDGMILELTERNTVEVRPATAADLRTTRLHPMTLDGDVQRQVG
jgi:antitoxin component of MazEF toxin-antitoxin module